MRFNELLILELNEFLKSKKIPQISISPSSKCDFEGFEFVLNNNFSFAFDKNFIFEILKILDNQNINEISKKEIVIFKIFINSLLRNISVRPKFSDYKEIKNIRFIDKITNFEIFDLKWQDRSFKFGSDEDRFDYDIIKSLDVELKFKIASKELSLKEIFSLKSGSEIDFDKFDEIEIILGDKVIGCGEFVRLEDDNLGIKILHLKDKDEFR